MKILQDELRKRRTQIETLTAECAALESALKILSAVEPEKPALRAKTVAPAPAGQGSAKTCLKHPGAEMSPKGECKTCKKEYMKAYWEKRKKRDAAPSQPAPKVNGDARVACNECGQKYANAKDLGLHKTQVHFGDESSYRRSASL